MSKSSSSSSMSTSSHKQIKIPNSKNETNNSQTNKQQSNIPGKIKQKNFEMKYISKWNVNSTIEWLKHIGYEDCGVYFKEHRINGRALLMLGEDDLKEIIKHNVGQRKNLYHLIRLLQIKYNRYMNKLNSSFFSNPDDDEDDEYDRDDFDDVIITNKENDHETTKLETKISSNEKNNVISYENEDSDDFKNKYNSSIHNHLFNEIDELNSDDAQEDSGHKNNKSSPKSVSNFLKKNRNENMNNVELEEHNMLNFCENCLKKFDDSPYTNYSNTNSSSVPIRSYKGEKRKTLISMIYLFLSCLWTSFMLTVVHDRVPDMQKYPPLPDIILDNVPLIPWAFFATEIIGLVLAFIMFVVLIFHKYKTIIFRRMCSLAATIFFLRSITMLITSLSVPGIHIQCSSQKYGSFMNKLNGAWNILSGVGLYVHGIRTCGDYMFSGHTVWLTLLTHFITEYTPVSLSFLHTFTWVLNIFGLFFILGAHEHYSIDVFVAFYITSRLFLYYHSLANNKVLFQRDHKRVKVWFPMLSYFESNIHSIVPNQYEFPPNFITYIYRLIRNKFRQIKRLVGYGHVNGNINGNKHKNT